MFDLILAGHFDYPSPHWDHVSESARDLIDQMLLHDVDNRLSADEVLKHPWVSVSIYLTPSSEIVIFISQGGIVRVTRPKSCIIEPRAHSGVLEQDMFT